MESMDFAILEATLRRMANKRTPEQVFCSQCGQPQGLGFAGYSHCQDHRRMNEYKAALAAMDWQFEFSDEHRRWAAGTNALARLHRMQREVDPTGEVWLSYPGAQTHLAPQPRILEVACV